MPLDIWLKSDDIDRNNKTSVRSEMGAAVMPSHPLNIKQFPFLCVQNSSSRAVQWCWSSLVLKLGLFGWVGTFPSSQTFCAVSVSCPGLVTGAAEPLPGWLQLSAVLPVTCEVLGVHIPVWKETSGCAVCPGGGDGRAGSGITAIWVEDLLSSHPCQLLLFLWDKNNLKKGSLQVLLILCQGDVLVKLEWGAHSGRGFFFLLELWAWAGGLHVPGWVKEPLEHVWRVKLSSWSRAACWLAKCKPRVKALVGALSLPVVGEEKNYLTWGWWLFCGCGWVSLSYSGAVGSGDNYQLF